MSEEYNFDFGKGSSEPIKTASEQADDKLNEALKKLSKWRSVVVLGAMTFITLVLPFARVGFVNPMSVDFWFNAVYSLITATLCYYIFTPFGARSERLESSTYIGTMTRWTDLSGKVRSGGLIEAFYKFCHVRREEERQERRALFIEAASIPVEIYESEYARLTPEQIKARRKSGELTKKQAQYLIAANGEIKVAPINPSMILSGLKMTNINDVGREKRRRWFGILKPMTLIATMLIRGALQISGNGDLDFVDYITQTATSLFIILSWSFAGFRYGVANVRDEEQVMRGRAEFLSMFLERVKKQEGVAAVEEKSPAG